MQKCDSLIIKGCLQGPVQQRGARSRWRSTVSEYNWKNLREGFSEIPPLVLFYAHALVIRDFTVDLCVCFAARRARVICRGYLPKSATYIWLSRKRKKSWAGGKEVTDGAHPVVICFARAKKERRLARCWSDTGCVTQFRRAENKQEKQDGNEHAGSAARLRWAHWVLFTKSTRRKTYC